MSDGPNHTFTSTCSTRSQRCLRHRPLSTRSEVHVLDPTMPFRVECLQQDHVEYLLRWPEAAYTRWVANRIPQKPSKINTPESVGFASNANVVHPLARTVTSPDRVAATVVQTSPPRTHTLVEEGKAMCSSLVFASLRSSRPGADCKIPCSSSGPRSSGPKPSGLVVEEIGRGSSCVGRFGQEWIPVEVGSSLHESMNWMKGDVVSCNSVKPDRLSLTFVLKDGGDRARTEGHSMKSSITTPRVILAERWAFRLPQHVSIDDAEVFISLLEYRAAQEVRCGQQFNTPLEVAVPCPFPFALHNPYLKLYQQWIVERTVTRAEGTHLPWGYPLHPYYCSVDIIERYLLPYGEDDGSDDEYTCSWTLQSAQRASREIDARSHYVKKTHKGKPNDHVEDTPNKRSTIRSPQSTDLTFLLYSSSSSSSSSSDRGSCTYNSRDISPSRDLAGGYGQEGNQTVSSRPSNRTEHKSNNNNNTSGNSGGDDYPGGGSFIYPFTTESGASVLSFAQPCETDRCCAEAKVVHPWELPLHTVIPARANSLIECSLPDVPLRRVERIIQALIPPEFI